MSKNETSEQAKQWADDSIEKVWLALAWKMDPVASLAKILDHFRDEILETAATECQYQEDVLTPQEKARIGRTVLACRRRIRALKQG